MANKKRATALDINDYVDLPSDDELQASVEPLTLTDQEKLALTLGLPEETKESRALWDRILASLLLTGSVAADFAFRRNATAFVAIRHASFRVPKDKASALSLQVPLIITDIYERVPGATPLRPSLVCGDCARFAIKAKQDQVIADGHYRESVDEHLWAHGITLTNAPDGNQGKDKVYMRSRALIQEQLVLISPQAGTPHLRAKLKRQLGEIVIRSKPGGITVYESPTWRTGEHGDIASAALLAIWHASLFVENAAVVLPDPDDEAEMIKREARDIKNEMNKLGKYAKYTTGMRVGRR